MFEFIDGHFVCRGPAGQMVLYNDRNGIGYQIQTLSRDWREIDEETGEIRVFVRAVFSETAGYTLYGFEDARDRRAFDVLCKAQGIGGKMAMAILDQLTIEELAGATTDTFKPVKGVGPKVAARIIPELPALADLMASGPKAIDGVKDEVVTALVSLGYPRDKALKAAAAAEQGHPDGDQSALLRAAVAIL